MVVGRPGILRPRPSGRCLTSVRRVHSSFLIAVVPVVLLLHFRSSSVRDAVADPVVASVLCRPHACPGRFYSRVPGPQALLSSLGLDLPALPSNSLPARYTVLTTFGLD